MTIRKMPEPRAKAAKGEPERFLREVALPYDGDECLIWPYARSRNGYGNMKRGDRNVVVSRLVCEMVKGAPPSDIHEAAHSCGRGHDGCITPRHLSWKMPAENNRDKISHGTHLRGENQNGAKLNADEVQRIRSLEGSRSQRSIARQAGVSPQHVNDILRKKSWAWLEGSAQ